MSVANFPAHLVDVEVFEEMREALEEDFVDLIQTYLEDTRELLQVISSGVNSGDTQSVQIAAHSLKSTSATLGFVSLFESARAVEALARDSSLSGTAEHVQKLTTDFSELECVLKSAE